MRMVATLTDNQSKMKNKGILQEPYTSINNFFFVLKNQKLIVYSILPYRGLKIDTSVLNAEYVTL